LVRLVIFVAIPDNPVLKSGSLEARAGQIQAAINLEVQDFDVDFINLKLEGLNGQLPNLDLHNLVQKLAHKHSIATGYKLQSAHKRRGKNYEERLQNLVSMVLTQANGVPTGNHGLFHKYGIQALTLECFKTDSTNFQRSQMGAMSLLKIVEGISRSLNNLLERFHQSFFFYLILSSDRFVSIGDYMPCIGLMAGALLVKAFIVWLSINQDPKSEADDGAEEQDGEKEPPTEKQFNFINVGFLFIIAHFVGVLTSVLPLNKFVDGYLHANQIPTQFGLFFVFVTLTVLMLPLPIFWNLNPLGNDVICSIFLVRIDC
jgi:GPI-anchor transamidase subunit GAA1